MFSSIAAMSSAKAQIYVDVKVIISFPRIYPDIKLSVIMNNIRTMPRPVLLLLVH